MSESAVSFVSALLLHEVGKRLGSGPTGKEDIKNHRFLEGGGAVHMLCVVHNPVRQACFSFFLENILGEFSWRVFLANLVEESALVNYLRTCSWRIFLENFLGEFSRRNFLENFFRESAWIYFWGHFPGESCWGRTLGEGFSWRVLFLQVLYVMFLPLKAQKMSIVLRARACVDWCAIQNQSP